MLYPPALPDASLCKLQVLVCASSSFRWKQQEFEKSCPFQLLKLSEREAARGKWESEMLIAVQPGMEKGDIVGHEFMGKLLKKVADWSVKAKGVRRLTEAFTALFHSEL